MKKVKTISKILLLVAAAVLIVVAVFAFKHYHLADSSKMIVENGVEKVGEVISNTKRADQVTETDNSFPEKALIEVPFTVQAPNSNWDATHEEACEEASLIILKHFIKKEPMGSPEQVEAEIQSMIKYETDNGYKQDITMDELAQIARDYYGFKTARVEKNITVEDIKRELAAGRPVIVPASGKKLDNPNFKNGGPLYHNLVIVGYDKKGFITNDPGTRKGEGFRYTYENLFNAIHDWNPTDINQGKKVYLVFD